MDLENVRVRVRRAGEEGVVVGKGSLLMRGDEDADGDMVPNQSTAAIGTTQTCDVPLACCRRARMKAAKVKPKTGPTIFVSNTEGHSRYRKYS